MDSFFQMDERLERVTKRAFRPKEDILQYLIKKGENLISPFYYFFNLVLIQASDPKLL